MALLNRVTITGVDEKTDKKQLTALTRDFPFVEWGVLFSINNAGSNPRYPSLKWISEFDMPNTSIHVCGRAARNMASRDASYDMWLKWFTELRGQNPQRVQLNIHAKEDEKFDLADAIAIARNHPFNPFIFPIKKMSHPIIHALDVLGDFIYQPHILLDASGGKGVENDFEAFPESIVVPGYAGGIGPENVIDKIEEINSLLTSSQRYWIDMESKVRTEDWLDLDKVYAVLSAAKPYYMTSYSQSI